MKKQYKILGIILVLAIASVMVVGVAIAQTPEDGTAPVVGPNFTDEDGDGVCDMYGTDQMGQMMGGQWGNADGTGTGTCDNFVDEDGDGVCDLYGTGQMDQMMGGQGHMMGGHGQGRMGGQGGGRW